jgi:imidazolonepropionase-like amidohydrolase
MHNKKSSNKIFSCTVVLSFCYLLFTISLQAQNTVIKAGHLFDSRTGKILHDQTIVIKDGKILEVGSNLKYSSTDTIIDLSKSWVLPGLMDCHVHITENSLYRKRSRGMPVTYFTESTSFRALRGGYVGEQFLRSGFTTIKEIGNDANYATADVIKAIKEGWVKGPTIFYAGKIIAPYGGQSRGVNIENEHEWQFEYIDADTPDEIKKAVRKNIYYGANTIKLVTGDNGIYDVEDIKAAVDEAKKYGIKVTVHVADKAGATNVISGGAAAIEHGFGLDNTQLQLMKDSGTFLVGTDFSFDNWYAYGLDSATATALTDKITDRLKRAYKIGTKMAFGTDIIIDLPGLNRVQSGLKVLQTWKAAGIPASYILQTMTIYAAELLGIEKSKGIVAPNFIADIIALKNNPLDDIDAIKDVQFVMKEGKVIKQD